MNRNPGQARLHVTWGWPLQFSSQELVPDDAQREYVVLRRFPFLERVGRLGRMVHARTDQNRLGSERAMSLRALFDSAQPKVGDLGDGVSIVG